MATRVIKSGGSSIEFALAPEPLHVEDLDTDLDNIFGNIDNSNIAAGAGISTSKIAQDQGIQTGHLANGAVTGPKLAVGATVDAEILNGTAVGGFSIGLTPVDVIVLPPMQVNGGTILLLATLSWSITLAAPGTGSAIVQISRDSTPIMQIQFGLQNTVGGILTVPLPSPQWTDKPVAGTYSYKIVAATADANSTITVPGIIGGFSAVELR